jgi:coenzyme F420-reducing hydrogenase delta subunit
MKKIIRLTESDLTRIVKRVISENNEDIFFLRRLQKYDALIDYKMKEVLSTYCKGSKKLKQRENFVERIRDFIYEEIERFDVLNISFNPWIQDYSEKTKGFEKIFNSVYVEKIERFFDENCKMKSPSK